MGSLAEDMEKSKSQIKITELHPYFGAEISGVNLSTPMSDEVFENIVALSAKYGVIVFRSTGLDDTSHVELARRFGPLFSMKKVLGNTKTRLKTDELADLSNIDPDTGEPVPAEGPKAQIGRLASFFHPDLAYSQQRASWSLLRAHEIPPPGYGGDTIFADTRTAFDQLDDVESGLKKRLLSKNYCGVHSWQHAQKISNPDLFKDLDPSAYPMARHQLVELHQPSNRMNLYIGLYMHHIECAPEEDEEMADLQHKLLKHATQAKYQLHVEWHHPGDLVIWDNSITQSWSGKLCWTVQKGLETRNCAGYLTSLAGGKPEYCVHNRATEYVKDGANGHK